MIIAEIGLNHFGKEENVKKIVNYLLKTNVDAITLQIRENEFYSSDKWKYFTLKDDFYKTVSMKVRSNNKKFGIALSDLDKIEQHKNYCDFFKILSKDITNINGLRKFANTGKKCYISTGNSDLNEIKKAVDVFDDTATLIHTRLSNKANDVNLLAMSKMKQYFNNNIAFGNHCQNLNVLYTSIAYQPSDYFFYVKDNFIKKSPPDDLHALDLEVVDEFCNNILELKKSIGDGIKTNTKNTIGGQK